MTKLRIKGGWEEVVGRDVWGENLPPQFLPLFWELPPVWVCLGTLYPQSEVGR